MLGRIQTALGSLHRDPAGHRDHNRYLARTVNAQRAIDPGLSATVPIGSSLTAILSATSAATSCLACGAPVGSGLELTGSLRCHDCRDTNAAIPTTNAFSVESRVAEGGWLCPVVHPPARGGALESEEQSVLFA
jgi:hypothetical protein